MLSKGLIMRELLGKSFSAWVVPNDFSCQHQSYYLITCTDRRCSRGIQVNRLSKSSRICSLKRELNVASMSLVKIPQPCFSVRSTGTHDSLILPNMDASVNSRLVYGEEEDELVHQGDERILEPFVVRKSPPWGDLVLREDSKIEPTDINQTSSISKEMVAVNETSVHFLEETDEMTLSNRIMVLSRKNRFRSALELFRSMELMGLLPSLHACNSLLSCLLRNRLLDNGLKVFNFMKRKKLSTGHTYSLILKAVANASSCDSALEMFTEWEHDHEVKKHFDAIVYNTMISVCGKVNNWVEAERIWRLMEANGCSTTRITYCLLVTVFVHCNQNELALDAYGEMIKNHFEPGNDTMQAIIGACAKEEKWDFALSIFQDMLKSRFQPNLIACNALINALGKAGKVKQAFEVYEILKSLGHQPDVYTWNALLGALYKANQYDKAIQLFESIRRDHAFELNNHLYNTTLMSCSKLGLWEKALQILWQMEDSEFLITISSYNLVISACEMARKPEIALQVYEHMIYKNHAPDTFTHLSLIRCCIWGSRWVEVDELLNKAAPNVSLYNAAIQGMCLRGKIDAAKKLYMKMREKGLQPDGKTRALMLQNFSKNSIRQKNNNRWYSHPRRKYQLVSL